MIKHIVSLGFALMLGISLRSEMFASNASPEQHSEQQGKANRLLHQAAGTNDFRLLCIALLAGAEVDYQDESGFTALILFARKGNQRAVQHLLTLGAKINHALSYCGYTALHETAICGDSHMAELLLDNNASIDQPDRDRETPLSLAVSNACLKLVLLFLTRRADARLVNLRSTLWGYQTTDTQLIKLLITLAQATTLENVLPTEAYAHNIVQTMSGNLPQAGDQIIAHPVRWENDHETIALLADALTLLRTREIQGYSPEFCNAYRNILTYCQDQMFPVIEAASTAIWPKAITSPCLLL
jgi:hypothetical protein